MNIEELLTQRAQRPKSATATAKGLGWAVNPGEHSAVGDLIFEEVLDLNLAAREQQDKQESPR